MPRLRSNIVAVYIARPAGRDVEGGIELLMLQRPEGHRFAGAWQTVGGHIEEKRGETAWQAAIRETDEETGLEVERWFRIDRPESFYNPENDTVYFVPAFAALVAADAEPVLSDEHQAWRWQTPEDAARAVDWAAMRESILLVGEALVDSNNSGLGLSEFSPTEIGTT